MKRLKELALLSGLLLAAIQTAAQDPPLPPGLSQPQAPPSELGPALPPGLGSESSGPALPPGLDGPRVESPLLDERGEPRQLAIHGFWEVRAGVRMQDDPAQPRDAILGESRLQLDYTKTWERITFEVTGDFILDGVLEEADFDLRRLRVLVSLSENLDLAVGRQVLTWGTGDLLFINDLFPKDWQSFLIGRDVEYLKAPSDALKLSWFLPWINIDFVYTPQFEADRFITGERISFWNPIFSSRSGRENQVDFNAPSAWFKDDEFALRLYRTFGSTELAVYAYNGYWKSPAGQTLMPLFQASFPRLSVYGASVRGTVGKGVVNVEGGYYDSRDDRGGDNMLVENSEFRFLAGYERELGKELTGGVQYYYVRLLDYDAYRRSLLFFIDPRDEHRHVFTMRLTKLLMNQDLTLSSFLFYSPSDGDAYWRPSVQYKLDDNWQLGAGANVFIGRADHTFFGQFEDNSNVYLSIRYGF